MKPYEYEVNLALALLCIIAANTSHHPLNTGFFVLVGTCFAFVASRAEFRRKRAAKQNPAPSRE